MSKNSNLDQFGFPSRRLPVATESRGEPGEGGSRPTESWGNEAPAVEQAEPVADMTYRERCEYYGEGGTYDHLQEPENEEDDDE